MSTPNLSAVITQTGLDVSILATITAGTGPFVYTIDYGDGITDSLSTSSTTHIFTHTYLDTTPKTIQVQASMTILATGTWQITNNAAKISSFASGGFGTLFYALLDTGTPYNDVTAVVNTPATDCDILCGRSSIAAPASGPRMGVICQSGTLIWIVSIGSDRSGTAVSGVTYPATIRTSYSNDGIMRIFLNGSLVNLTGLSGTERSIYDTATVVGMSTLQGSPAVIDSFSTSTGISDSFNRTDSLGLGVTDTGQVWNYSPTPSSGTTTTLYSNIVLLFPTWVAAVLTSQRVDFYPRHTSQRA